MIVFLCSFYSALFLYFFQVHLYLKWRLTETFLHSFWSFCWGVLNQLLDRRWTRLLCWRQTLSALETNVFWAGDEHFSAGDQRVENGIRTSDTHTASYQRLPNRLYVEMIATSTHLRKWVLSCSRTQLRVYATSTSYICYGPIRNLQPVSKPAGRFQSWPASFKTGRSLYGVITG